MTRYLCALLLAICYFKIITCVRQTDLLSNPAFLKLEGRYKRIQYEECTERYSCLNCTTARICAPNSIGQLREIQQVTCSGSTPVCNPETGTCTKATGLDCMSEVSSSFVCQNDGYFPDGQDCSLFHYCKNYVSYTYNCSSLISNSYYNVGTKKCDTGYYYYCNYDPFYCSGLNGQKSYHRYDSSIFAYCISGKPQIIDRCMGSEVLNSTSQKCEIQCQREGLVQDINDCTSYYECKYVAYPYSYYQKTHRKCRQGEAFEPSEFQCVPIWEATSCSSSYSTTPFTGTSAEATEQNTTPISTLNYNSTY